MLVSSCAKFSFGTDAFPLPCNLLGLETVHVDLPPDHLYLSFMTAYIQDAIILFGDSLTQGGWQAHGFAQRLALDYARKLDVVNRGISGYNTEWAIPVFEQCLPLQHEQAHVPKMRLLTIWFGANDACLPHAFQHVPLNKFSANLSTLIQMVTSATSPWYSPTTKIILITPPPLNSSQWSAFLQTKNPPFEMDRTPENTARYAQAVRDVGTKEKTPIVDVFSAIMDAADGDEKALEKYLSDGLHLTEEGYTIVYDQLINTIRKEYPELHFDSLNETFIAWAQVDRENLRDSVTKRKN